MATFFSRSTKNVSDVNTTIYTSTSDSTIILSVLVANTGANATDINCSLLDASNNVKSQIANTITVPQSANIDLIGNKLILSSGNKLRISTSTSGSCDLTLSFVEV